MASKQFETHKRSEFADHPPLEKICSFYVAERSETNCSESYEDFDMVKKLLINLVLQA